MGGVRSYDVVAESAGAPGVVWALLLDVDTWPVWSRVDEAEDSPGGRVEVGTFRTFRTGKVVTKERITVLEAERRFGYEGVVNPQLTGYRATVDLTELPNGGTRIRWRGTYTARWGMRWFMKPYLQRYMGSIATGLADHAARADPRYR
ncbi:SRPBCC family protein [Actinokineospora globicatena]|nr:SRPBCC family protein [Actinokineospora globicatena]